MTIGLVGRKCGMTRVFTDAGVTVPVTVVEALPNRMSQVKSEKSDGYRAVQVTVGPAAPRVCPRRLPAISPRPMSPPATPPRNSA
jgi:ribosomal protein L3